MDKVYQHLDTEKKWYDLWEKEGYFTPKKIPSKQPFTIILPPPNANADLHMGHAMYVVEDIMIRYHRMKGDSSLWLPGADHAGFETQYVYEKRLAKEGKSRFDFSREDLYQNIWDFVFKNRGTMENQIRRLGFSVDWSRQIFTLDPKIIKTVYQTFKRMYDEGLIYRSERLVNYCTRDGTGFSDLEVVNKETEGLLYFIKYPLTTGGFITVATTRPETMLGDAAVMVNPKDKRYSKVIGKLARLPLTDRTIPLIADEHVDMKFGTGAVKVTPSHDFTDAEVAETHHLSFPPVIGFNGRIQNSGEFNGLKVKAAREAVLARLEEKGLVEKTEHHNMVVKTCYKCGNPLEPLPLPQWYVKIKPLANNAIKAIKAKNIIFYPRRFEKSALTWLKNFHDWNISRQIVWGIRIPAWKCESCGKDGKDTWIVTDGIPPVECSTCHSHELIQETDTFDTWFSSGQWPFATLKASPYPGDFEYFYPTSVMETGYDILPWWVCRMIMLGIYATGKIPFRTVFLHGLVRDAKGQKMSKSKGNVINPLLMADKYGADALRFALVYGTAGGHDLALDENKIRAMRNFSNKLWNIGRFIKMNMDFYLQHKVEITPYDGKSYGKHFSPENKKILSQLHILIRDVTKAIESFQFDKGAELLYEYIWHTFADKFIEASKEKLKANDQETLSVLIHVFITSLVLLHPYMPFVTEELTHQLDPVHKPLIICPWPKSKI